jgi:chromosome transmission fidelity protein 1
LQLVVLPYQSLFHSPTRESLGISLKGHIVIVDEVFLACVCQGSHACAQAHNLIESLNEMYSVVLTGCQVQHISPVSRLTSLQLEQAEGQLKMYLARYVARLSGSNMLHCKQILYLLRALAKHLTPASIATKCSSEVSGVSAPPPKPPSKSICTLNDFSFAAKVDNFNLLDLARYLQRSQLPRKLQGFVQWRAQAEAATPANGNAAPSVERHLPAMGVGRF